MQQRALWQQLLSYSRGNPQVQLTAPGSANQAQLPCMACQGLCCQQSVAINVVDLARLVVLLGVVPKDVVELAAAQNPYLAPVLLEGRSTPVELRLKTTEQEYCSLLVDIGGQKRCGVYAIRPGGCRVFPFEFAVGAWKHRLGSGDCDLCGQSWSGGKQQIMQWQQDIGVWLRENAAASRIVQKWNSKNTGGEQAFYPFVIKKAARYLKMNPRVYLERVKPQSRFTRRLW